MKNNNRRVDKDDVINVIAGMAVGSVIVGYAYIANSLHPVLNEKKRQQLRNKKNRKDKQ